MAGKAQLLAGEWHLFLGGLQAKVKDPSALLKAAFMTAGFQDLQQHFRDESGPKGKWADRSFFTELAYAKKNKKFLGNKILHMTGRLFGSILPGNTKKISYNAIEIFANSKYGRIHDMGGPFKAWGKHPATMPQREFMWFSDKAQGLMANIISSLAFGVK